ncbi:MAG: hypothetical protein H6807_05820 [Planctomycetes bacterium]|nr:hypothetical protein [Planctomycetota bacterium]
MTRSLECRGDRGVALIVVLSVLAMLLVIATPFVLQAKKDYQSSLTTAEQRRARRIAESALLQAKLGLEATNQGLEHAGGGAATPWWDDAAELGVDAHPDFLREFGGGRARYMGDPRGDLWSIAVRDEQAFVNADSAPPFLWSGLLGRAELSRDHAPSDGVLQVDSTAGFPAENGKVVIGGRVLSYRKTTPDSFQGVQLEEAYPKGAWVLNKSAWDLALYSIRSPRAAGGITSMPSLTAIKELALYGSQALDEAELDRILGPFTVYGARDAVSGWLSAQSLVADVDPDAFDEKRGQPVRVANPDFFNEGTIVRLADAAGAEYHVVSAVRRRGGEGVLYLVEPVTRVFDWRESSVAARMRHPVNVNACSREVLLLLLEGLEYAGGARRFSDPNDRIGPQLAANIAEVMIKNRPLRGIEHLVQLLSAMYQVKAGTFSGGGAIDAAQVTIPGYERVEMRPEHALAVVQNAINPNHRLLIGSTMPMSFVSGDYFSVEAGASVNDASGSELARHRIREVFRSAPVAELRYRLDSQADFEAPILSGRGARYIETHPNPVARFVSSSARPEQRLLRFMHDFEEPGGLGIFPSTTEGDIRLQPARLYGGWTEHFDGALSGIAARGVPGKGTRLGPEFIDPEGFPLRATAFPLELGVSGRSAGRGRAAATVADGRGLNPFVLEFFLKPRSWGGGVGLFSAYGRDPALDKIEAWYESSDRSLRLKVHDVALDDPRFAVESAAEVSWSPRSGRLEDDTWYHLGFQVEGSKPGQIALHVDGFKRGKSKFISTLSGAMNESADTFSVEDANDWPDEGAFLIGTEVVNAVRTTGNDFQVFQNPNGAGAPGGRGVRGTEALSHRAGETVTLFGYSAVLSHFDADQAGEVLGEGGAALESELRPFDYGALVGDETDVIKLPMNLTLGVEILDLPAVTELELRTFADGDLAVEQECFQSSGGYAIIVAPEFPGDNELDEIGDLSDWNIVQMIRYESRDDEKLLGVSAVNDPLNPDLVEGQGLSGAAGGNGGQAQLRFYSRALRKIVTRNTSAGSKAPPLAFIFPISVELTGNEGYRGPEFNGNGSPQNEYLQVGRAQLVPSLRSFAAHRIEWIAYTGVDRQRNSFVFNAKNRLNTVCRLFSNYVGQALLGNLATRPDPAAIAAQFNWRFRAGTDQFGWDDPTDANDRHAGGTAAIPCFRVSTVGGNPLGYGDCVTLMRADNGARELAFVSWAWNDWAALTSNVRSRVLQIGLPQVANSNLANSDDVSDRRRYARLVKFPSGELPLIDANGDANIGMTAAQGQVDGHLDEVRLRTLAREQFTLWDESVAAYGGGVTPPRPYPLGVDGDATEIPIVGSLWVPRLPQSFTSTNGFVTVNWLPDGRQLDLVDPLAVLQGDAGLVMIDDEIIAFRELDQSPTSGGYVLRDCERGFMNTERKDHSFGARIVFLDFRPVSRLAQQIQPDDADLLVVDGQDFGITDINERSGGTVLIDREMVHFSRIDQNVMRMPQHVDPASGDRVGIFRGRYGTRRGSHAQDAIVLDMPFRYWDRYAPACDDPELAFYEFSVNQPRSFFKRISWRTRYEKPHIRVELLCRLDPTVPWDLPPERSGGRLVRFGGDSGTSQDKLEEALLNVDGKGMEVRVFFVYEPEAFDPDELRINDWKETPRLLDLELRYLAAPWVLQREELR